MIILEINIQKLLKLIDLFYKKLIYVHRNFNVENENMNNGMSNSMGRGSGRSRGTSGRGRGARHDFYNNSMF